MMFNIAPATKPYLWKKQYKYINISIAFHDSFIVLNLKLVCTMED